MRLRVLAMAFAIFPPVACATPEYGSSEVTKSEVVDKRVAAAPLKSNDRSFSQNLALVRGVEARLRGAADPVCREVSGDVCAFTVRIVDNDNPNASANERSEVVLNTGLLRYLDG